MKEQLETLINELVERGVDFEDAMNEFQKKFIRKVLEKHNGNQSKTAQSLGIHRNTLSRKIAEFGLDHRPRARSHPHR